MMLVPSNFLPPGYSPLPVPGSYLPFFLSSLRFHRPVRSYQAVPAFSSSFRPFFFAHTLFFLVFVCPGNPDIMHCRRWASSCFLLVIALSRQHLALAALSLVRSSEESSSEAYSVVWSSPAPGDRFGPGDTIVGEWQVTPQKVVSPSFRLCAGGEDGCGATVWPEVVEESEGSYYASLTAPTVSTESGYYLQMKDDFGHAFSSPIFNITRERAHPFTTG
ncbi:hypothetical protein BJV77DRAFT_307569 [Russula vinacea]|nr:hypothetical protein BJV77DRAFT_307569 [Russula vinacea]